MSASGRVTLGRITAAFGVRGWIKVESFTDPPESLLEQEEWQLQREGGGDEPRRVRVTQVLSGGDAAGRFFRVSLEGLTDRDAAAALGGMLISVPRAALPPAGPREHYRDDLIGLAVRSVEGAKLGVVSHFTEVPSGPMMVLVGERERWVPAFEPYLRRVDHEAREIVVDWPADI